jgi:hypothetical protein
MIVRGLADHRQEGADRTQRNRVPVRDRCPAAERLTDRFDVDLVCDLQNPLIPMELGAAGRAAGPVMERYSIHQTVQAAQQYNLILLSAFRTMTYTLQIRGHVWPHPCSKQRKV